MSSLRPPEIEMLRTEIRKSTSQRHKGINDFDNMIYGHDPTPLLRTKPANEWLKQEYAKPAPNMLFGSLWFEGELCIMFADTNLGKSVLAVQIGDNITQGVSLQPLNNHLPAHTGVLYIDFELGAKQFESRYVSELTGSYRFDNEFYRAEFNPAAYVPWIHKNYDEFLNYYIDRALIESGASVLIIDNITYMRNGTERAKEALALMQNLKALKIKRKLSILVLAHTPKRNPTKPLTVNDLQGSKMLINFADSAFAIGQSYTRPNLRYLKQIKQRNQRLEYGEDNVCLISQEKRSNCLRFTFEGHAHERDHLARPAHPDKATLHLRVAQLHRQGRNLRQIADELNIHFSTAGRIVQQAKMSEPGFAGD